MLRGHGYTKGIHPKGQQLLVSWATPVYPVIATLARLFAPHTTADTVVDTRHHLQWGITPPSPKSCSSQLCAQSLETPGIY